MHMKQLDKALISLISNIGTHTKMLTMKKESNPNPKIRHPKIQDLGTSTKGNAGPSDTPRCGLSIFGTSLNVYTRVAS